MGFKLAQQSSFRASVNGCLRKHRCAECIAISKVLEIELAKQEPDTQPVDDLVGEIRC